MRLNCWTEQSLLKLPSLRAEFLVALIGLTALAMSVFFARPSHAETIRPQGVARHYANIVQASYADSLLAALAMQRAIDRFLARPSPATHAAAKQAWIAAREWYGQTEAFRFYGGPIDGNNGPESRINSWPVDEAYIDSVRDQPGSGIINDPSVPITKKHLSGLNQRGGEENICAGWHAIEFLLWGQDFNDAGPGDRSYEDFVDGSARNAKRRRQYLKVITGLLVDDLAQLVNEWRPSRNNYRARFVANPDEAIRLMLIGLGSLSRGELAGERLEVPLATQDQEDEQSCFSDNTHRDIIADALGIENVWLGRYRRLGGGTLQGPSLRDLVAARDQRLADNTTTDIETTNIAANAIQPPFDQEIRGSDDAPGRMRIQAVIDSLKKQTEDLVLDAEALGITKLTITGSKKK